MQTRQLIWEEQIEGIFNNKGSKLAKPVKDTKTRITYPGRASAGRAIAPEFGLDPQYRLVWYDILKRAKPNRFIDVNSGKFILRDGSLSF